MASSSQHHTFAQDFTRSGRPPLPTLKSSVHKLRGEKDTYGKDRKSSACQVSEGAGAVSCDHGACLQDFKLFQLGGTDRKKSSSGWIRVKHRQSTQRCCGAEGNLQARPGCIWFSSSSRMSTEPPSFHIMLFWEASTGGESSDLHLPPT